jgi:hypothetical protein
LNGVSLVVVVAVVEHGEVAVMVVAVAAAALEEGITEAGMIVSMVEITVVVEDIDWHLELRWTARSSKAFSADRKRSSLTAIDAVAIQKYTMAVIVQCIRLNVRVMNDANAFMIVLLADAQVRCENLKEAK